MSNPFGWSYPAGVTDSDIDDLVKEEEPMVYESIFDRIKEVLDRYLDGTDFETDFCHKFDVEKAEFTNEVIGVTIWKKGKIRRIVAVVDNEEHFDTMKAFMDTFMKISWTDDYDPFEEE
jgi:hypothetical protein